MKIKLSRSDIRGLHLALLILILGALITGVLGVLNLNDFFDGLTADIINMLTACPLKNLTQKDCPLCGTITAAHLAISGNLHASLKTNPLAIALTPLLCSQFVYRLIRIFNPCLILHEELTITGGGLLIALGIVIF